ncbi:hypothetical protein BOTBODRAFT_596514 [Botryobasidium botryosum FD-172 SS1]|uniref:Uncharacterized protein n=1 Tax=Botryobasidium botryosum (strain FD-172 SS1) TaxID=930990 RepID=A0A067M7S5_BOTB1|nr:hypothetical protein BOTBODRAFT_596514 [Botryobasidium botryosum FD-172 SS1]
MLISHYERSTNALLTIVLLRVHPLCAHRSHGSESLQRSLPKLPSPFSLPHRNQQRRSFPIPPPNTTRIAIMFEGSHVVLSFGPKPSLFSVQRAVLVKYSVMFQHMLKLPLWTKQLKDHPMITPSSFPMARAFCWRFGSILRCDLDATSSHPHASVYRRCPVRRL